MKKPRVIGVLLLISLLAGCAGLEPLLCLGGCNQAGRRSHRSSGLVSLLYPKGTDVVPGNELPTLPVPLRVGLAFLPEGGGASVEGLEPARREQILQRIAEHFRSRKFIADIILVPDYYLRDATGFEGLAGVQRLYSVDLVALVSYDQVRYQDDRGLALGYLTVVGAYVLKGTRQDVTTLMDMAVVDTNTRSIVLRAGGTDTRVHNTTYVGSEVAGRKAAADGFDAAAAAASAWLLSWGSARWRWSSRAGDFAPPNGQFIAMTGIFMQNPRPLGPQQRVHAERRCHPDGG